ncbi:MBL fold metallo-hydrolase [Geothermobacter hydrogeniphilus]|nr:MBL fold metallo-hydrolase [Geothermobacter hydrogeniphilus]
MPPAKIIESVAAVFCYQGEIFALRRQPYLQAFPGYESFPGGKIDRDDPDLPHPSPLLREWDGKRMHALVREVREELGYDLPAGIASGQVKAVHYLAKALAPPVVAARFFLHVFRIDLETRPVFSADPGEIADCFWKTPRQLLDSFERGDALMVPPLRWVLQALERDPQGVAFGDLSPRFDEDRFVISFEQLSDVRILPVPSNTFPPVKRTNAFLLGDPGAPRILVDPSPESPQVLEKLLRTLEPETLSALFLTHHHHDHHEHVPQLARRLGVPVWMSDDTRERILKKYGSDYFTEVRLEIRREGDELTRWKGETVRVFEIPGHDAGQLALAPESLRWFLVGDLIQGAGTVVIAAPEGDMAAYFGTLERIIALDPAVILPSHGAPMRGTHRLRETLRHRREREEAIHRLFVSGKTKAEILDTVYQGVDQQLLPFALLNIESHLVKLRREGRI